MKTGRTVKIFLKILVSLGFLAWIFFEIDWQEVFLLLRRVEIGYVILYFITLILGILISAHKWKILANFKGIKLSLDKSFKLYLAGTFVNNFLPSFIGGDTYRVYQIGRKDKKYSQAASSVVMDRMTGLFGAMLLALFFSLLNLNLVSKNHALIILNLIMAACIILVFAFFFAKKRGILKSLGGYKDKMRRYVPQKVTHFIEELIHYQSEIKILGRALFFSVIFGIVGLAAANYILFLALGVKVNVIDYLSVIFLISFVSSIPVSVNNIGIKEWAYVTFFGFFGIGSSIVVTVAILSRFFQMILSFAALPTYLKSKDPSGFDSI